MTIFLFQICSKHKQKDISVPIQPISSAEDVEEYKEEKENKSAFLMKRVYPDQGNPTQIVTKLNLWFPCWNKCGE